MAAKQATIATTTNISMQDLTCKFLQGGNANSAFTVTGSALTLFKDSSNNTLMGLQNGSIDINKPLDCYETALFRKTVQINDSGNSLSGQLYIATGNKLRYQGQNAVTEDVMFAYRIAKMQFGSEFSVVTQAATGQMIIAKKTNHFKTLLSFLLVLRTL